VIWETRGGRQEFTYGRLMMAALKSMLVGEVEAVDCLAVDVELQLVRGTVPDPYRARSFYPSQWGRISSIRSLEPSTQYMMSSGPPLPPTCSWTLATSQRPRAAASSVNPIPSRRIDQERGITNPGVPVVLVALAPDLLRQCRGWCCVIEASTEALDRQVAGEDCPECPLAVAHRRALKAACGRLAVCGHGPRDPDAPTSVVKTKPGSSRITRTGGSLRLVAQPRLPGVRAMVIRLIAATLACGLSSAT
jgi:hypothetical protein